MSQVEKTYQIKIEGLRLFAYHGVFPEENKLGQEFEIELLLTLENSPLLHRDELENVVSYWEVMKDVKEVFTGKTFKLLENAALTILDSLAEYPQILHARVHVKKLTPPIPVSVGSVGVIIEREY